MSNTAIADRKGLSAKRAFGCTRLCDLSVAVGFPASICSTLIPPYSNMTPSEIKTDLNESHTEMPAA